jgi:hypothetical protein
MAESWFTLWTWLSGCVTVETTMKTKTMQFVARGQVQRTWRLRDGETFYEAVERVPGLRVGSRLCPDGTVRMAEWNGMAGEARFAR